MKGKAHAGAQHIDFKQLILRLHSHIWNFIPFPAGVGLCGQADRVCHGGYGYQEPGGMRQPLLCPPPFIAVILRPEIEPAAVATIFCASNAAYSLF